MNNYLVREYGQTDDDWVIIISESITEARILYLNTYEVPEDIVLEIRIGDCIYKCGRNE
jgi:hypothetical protein